MTKNLKGLLFLAIGMIGCSAAANAQATDTKTANATVGATIITPITIAETSNMNFGNIVANAAGTVVLSTAGGRTSTALQLPAVKGVVTAAAFTVTGQTDYAYTITLPTTYTIATGTKTATEVMSLSAFNHDATQVLTSGTETFHVGATLTVVAGQKSGTYVGDDALAVKVNYN